jgi:hypothetical protein
VTFTERDSRAAIGRDAGYRGKVSSGLGLDGMIVPEDATIPEEKLTKYLLISRPWDDNSMFLEQAGFEQENADELMAGIRRLAIGVEATEDGTDEYGKFYRVEGDLVGPNGRELPVVTIWLRWHSNGSFHFVTLKPLRKKL